MNGEYTSMKWSDEGMVLSSRKYSESALIVTLMTESHGRHSGLVRGGTNKRNRGVYEPGNILIVNWQARLEEHLGTFSCELRQSKAVEILNNPLKLAGLSSVCTVTECSLPEREPCPVFYKNLCKLI